MTNFIGVNGVVFEKDIPAVAGTDTKSLDIPITQEKLHPESLYIVDVFNYGAAELTVACINVESFRGADKDCKLTSFTVGANDSKSVPVRGWLSGKKSKAVFTTTALDAAIIVRKG